MAANVAEVVFYTEDSASPLTVNKPAAFASGELLLFFIGQDATSALADLTGPAGWTDQGNYNATSTQGRVWSHVFAGGDPSTWDFGYNAGADVAGVLVRITGADTTPTIVVTTSAAGIASGTGTSPSVTPTGTDDLYVTTMHVQSNGTALVETDPSGTTEGGQAQVAGNFMAVALAYQQLASGSATGTKSWTSITPANVSAGFFSVAVKSTGSAASIPYNPQRS